MKEQKVAIVTFGHHVSHRFDTAEEFLLMSIADGVVVKEESIGIAGLNPLERINLMNRHGVRLLVCDGITDAWSEMLSERGVGVVPGIRGNTEEVVRQFLTGDLIRHPSEIPWEGTE